MNGLIFSSPPLDGLLYLVMMLVGIGVRVEHLVLISRHQADKWMADLERDSLTTLTTSEIRSEASEAFRFRV